MGRSRVLSFISAFGPSRNSGQQNGAASKSVSHTALARIETPSPETPSPPLRASTAPVTDSPTRSGRTERYSSRPGSIAFTYNPPLMDVAEDTLPELQPIFTFLNSHGNKLYQEGYFLKLNDLDTYGRPCPDRQWVECYAQLVGTVLSLWDAAALDAAEQDGEVPPTFINLADASIKMIETLPTRNEGMQPLKNVLSISSAGKNRYLLHFNSFHSLIQWTAGIRLSMFEHASLYEAYTGSIIAGKGKSLNNIKTIMERCRFKHEDWARVRFGAGTPWRRCWFVITPPDEKEMQKMRKSMKKKSAYDRASAMVTGNIKFYDTKKTRKVQPIATITNAYSAYAIYPQSKPLIDQSTLIKIEGQITIHSRPESTTEGFVFVMPEVHPAVSGFEMMLQFLLPTFDTFGLYGRPTRLIADTNHTKSIMFAFPKKRRYGYLDTLDVANLIHTTGSQEWSEAEWRKQLKEATARRMAASGSETSSVAGSNPRYRSSFPARNGNSRSRLSRRRGASPTGRNEFNQSADAIIHDTQRENAPAPSASHFRGLSDTAGFSVTSKLSHNLVAESSPDSSVHDLAQPVNGVNERNSSDSDWKQPETTQAEVLGDHLRPNSPPAPVAIPPAFAHGPGEVPSTRPQPSPELRMANNRMSHGTLSQLASAGNLRTLGAATAGKIHQARGSNEQNRQETALGGSNWSETSDIQSNGDTRLQEQGPPVPEHRWSAISSTGTSLPPTDGRRLTLDISKAVKRKPLPQQQPPEQEALAPVREPSLEDLRYTMDEEALNRVGTRQLSSFSPDKDVRPDEASVYDDESTVSPDYASTHESVYSKRSAASVPKPRMGVMKTVGEPPKKDVVIGDVHYSLDEPKAENPHIPPVDFGPTLSYMPTTGRPSTSDTLKKFDQHRRDSDATEKRDKRYSIGMSPSDRPHSRSPSGDEYRRSVLWQPGMAAARPTTPGSLTAEQFVQQRAVVTPPVHVHHRTSSMTPPPARPVSGEWLAHSRSNSYFGPSRDSQPRPHSRGASSVMSFSDISSHLSAREQEHVARMTGSSFFNLSSENRNQAAQVNPVGLVGAIDAREREKKGIKEGMSNPMVQHAIAQRQHHFQQQFAPTYPPAPSMHGAPQHAHQNSFYSMPGASQTWDALSQMNRVDEPRRQSWYGQFTSQPTPSPPVYPQNQFLNQQHPGYFGNANAMHTS